MAYKVFLNAPTAACLKASEAKFAWRTVATNPRTSPSTKGVDDDIPQSTNILDSSSIESRTQEYVAEDWILPPATLGAASQRISDMYKNVIFPEGEDNEDEEEFMRTACEDTIGESGWESCSGAVSGEESLISWPPTNPQLTRSHKSLSRSLAKSQLYSRDDSEETSYAHTSTSSVTAFPTFVINLHTLASLSELTFSKPKAAKWTRKVNLLVAVLEVEGPESVRIKKGPDGGKEVSILKLVIGGEEGGVCKVTAWREVADLWGGASDAGPDESVFESEGVKRGDIAYLENILASSTGPGSAMAYEDSKESHISLTASPRLLSRLHICYRTLPTAPADRRFRPDLRLAASDPGLRKVANVVQWLEGVMGLGAFEF